MFKSLVLVVYVAVLTNGQVFRYSPANIGTATQGQQQVYGLSQNGAIRSSGPGAVGRTSATYHPVRAQSGRVSPVTFGRVVPVQSSAVTPVVPVVQPVPVIAQPVSSVSGYQSSSSIASQQGVPTFSSFSSPASSVVSTQQTGSSGTTLSSPTSVASSGRGVSYSTPSNQGSSYSTSSDQGASYSTEIEESSVPSPYGFSFDSVDENGTRISREETSDGSGVITGQYTLSDATGIQRIVTYTADQSGFNARVQTNEAGTITSNPANVQIESSAVSRR